MFLKYNVQLGGELLPTKTPNIQHTKRTYY